MWYIVVPHISCNLGLFVGLCRVDCSEDDGNTTRRRPLLTNLSTLSSSLQVSFWAYT